MRILITNHALAARAGTELYVRDLAAGLARRGHEVICFAPVLGPVAGEIRAQGVTVVDDLAMLTQVPDVIHGQHHPAAALAYMAFPDTPAIQACHGVLPWQEAPLACFPGIRRYVAVDEACRDFLVTDRGIAPEHITTILNGVDLDRFSGGAPARDDSGRQTRALLISNIADRASIRPFEMACRRAGLSLDVAGAGLDSVMDRPEAELGQYGVVFAKARAALEAMAMGCAVYLADYGKTGGLVTSDRFDDLRAWNFGLRRLTAEPDSDAIATALERIDWEDAARVTVRVRAEAGFERVIDAWEAAYASLAGMPPLHVGSPAGAMARYLTAILPHLAERDSLALRLFTTVNAGLARDRMLARKLMEAGGRQADIARIALELDPACEAARASLKRRPAD